MFASKKILAAAVAATSSLALAGCMSPYGGASAGYGNDGYYGGYGGYNPYGYGNSPYGGYGGYAGYNPYGYNPYGGWYNNYYYPGSGSYVYDRYGNRYVWTGPQQQYWETKRKDPSVGSVLSGPFKKRVDESAQQAESSGQVTQSTSTARPRGVRRPMGSVQRSTSETETVSSPRPRARSTGARSRPAATNVE